MAKPPASISYDQLMASIRSALKSGLLAAQRAIEYQRLVTYWQIGKEINLAAASQSIKITQKLYSDISRDIKEELGLELTADTLGRLVQFNVAYPVFPKNTPLTFTHYLTLMRVTDLKERKHLELKAIRESWAISNLKTTVAQLNTILLVRKRSSKLTLERGEPYVYCVHQYNDGTSTESYIDCGFKIDVPLNGMVVQSAVSSVSKDSRGVRVKKIDDRYSVHLYKEAGDNLYTYAATVENVVDGDTIDVRIDVGFSIHLYDRLRFRGINCPEVSTPEGKLAKKFLTDYFSQCPLIVLRTYKQKEEMYGRWLADVFTLKGSTDPYQIAKEGEFLNQRLLDEGLAEKYK